MRVIAGRLGGRLFASPRSHRTHPMSDRIKGALFAALGDITGLSVLDGFAGTGALGFEAASRGASKVLLIETDPTAQRTIADNIRSLGLAAAVRLIKANCSGWSDNNPQQRYDIVMADPPFDDLQSTATVKLSRHVASGGLFVLSWPGRQPLPYMEAVQLVQVKTYGDAQLAFYRAH